MAIHTETRRSDRYSGDGTTVAFAFPFKLMKGADAAVYVSDDGADEAQLDPTEYTVVLNADQDNNPGGVIVLNSPLAVGKVLVVISAQAYLQPAVFTNLGAFYPSNLNDSLDRLTIEIQQLLERLDRTLMVSVTSSRTPQETIDAILDVATHAQQYAEQAQAALQAALELKAQVEAQLEEEGDTQIGRVEDVGDEQARRVENMTDWALIGYGLGCNEEVWTAEENIAEGSVITLPRDMRYVVGHNHLRLSWNGCVLTKPANFEEIGTADSTSTMFKVKFPVEAGDEFMAWTVPLGRGEDVADVLEQISDLSDAVSDISEHAVYHDIEG